MSPQGAAAPRQLMDKGPRIVVDIAGIEVTADPAQTLITYALGSCIAVTLFDPGLRLGGMIHYMLPLSSTSPEKAAVKPGMFADTGVPLLFEKMYALGSQKKDLVVKVAGGGKIYEDKGRFDIGRRNHTILRKLFWKNKVLVASEDVGGSKSRTVSLDVGSGLVLVKSGGEVREL